MAIIGELRTSQTVIRYPTIQLEKYIRLKGVFTKCPMGSSKFRPSGCGLSTEQQRTATEPGEGIEEESTATAYHT